MIHFSFYAGILDGISRLIVYEIFILSVFLDSALYYFENLNQLEPSTSYPFLQECNVTMEQCWVNSMYKHDYQPPHAHSLDLSSIIVLKLPDELKKPPDGTITFINNSMRNAQDAEEGCHLIFPEVKDFYLFPARLLFKILRIHNSDHFFYT